MDLRRLKTTVGVRGRAAARARRRLRQVDDGRVPIVPTRTTRGEVIATFAVVPSARGDAEAVVVAVLASDFQGLPLGGVRKVAGRRVSQLGGDGGRGCGFSQDQGAGSPEGLGCEHCESREGARRQAGSVAIDEVLRQKWLERQELKDQMQSSKSTKALSAREKAVIKLDGLQEEEIDLTQLLLLKQQEISEAKSEAAEKAREVETLQARRLAEVDCDGSVSHVSSFASCSAPLSPQQWALGLAALPEDVRVKFVEWHNSVEIAAQGISGSIFGSYEPGVSGYVASSGSCLVVTNCGDIHGVRLQCGQGTFPLRGWR